MAGPDVGCLPRLQVESSRILILTTTASEEDVMLLITMEYDHKEHVRNDRKKQGQKLKILHGEINEIADETLQEINENIPQENVVNNFHESLVNCQYEEYKPEIVNCDILEGNQESFEEVNFDFKLPCQIRENIEEMDEYCDSDEDYEDDEYEYYYEEITDDEDI